MKFIATLFFLVVSTIWYYFSWKYLEINMSEILLSGQVSSQNNTIVILIILAGLFVLGVLFGKLLSTRKSSIKEEEFFSQSNYTLEKSDTNLQNEHNFIPNIENIETKNGSDSYHQYNQDSEETSDETKDEIDEILEVNTKRTDFAFFEELEDKSFANVSNNLKKKNADDLKLIEGIGPKIEQLLNNGGIYSYTDLAKTNIHTIKRLLEKGGTRYALHNPKTWTKQSLLASKGEFDTLKTYQDKLVKGVEQ